LLHWCCLLASGLGCASPVRAHGSVIEAPRSTSGSCTSDDLTRKKDPMMTTSAGTPQDGSVTSDVALLRALAIEQACRAVSHGHEVAELIACEPGSRAAHTALGRLLTGAAVTLRVGTPLLAFCSGTPVDPTWRQLCPIREGSLASTLYFYEQMYGPVAFPGAPAGLSGLDGGSIPAIASAANALAALDLLSDRAAADMLA
jgi:hypothetical protein